MTVLSALYIGLSHAFALTLLFFCGFRVGAKFSGGPLGLLLALVLDVVIAIGLGAVIFFSNWRHKDPVALVLLLIIATLIACVPTHWYYRRLTTQGYF
jgi:hypothetical protein